MARFSGINKYKWNYKVEKNKINEKLEIKKSNTFEKLVDEDYIDTLVQNILSHEHVINNNDKLIIIVHGEDF